MNYLSVCSGIEAATVGWHSLGWQPVAFSEIEKFPCSALAHHYPDVPNWGDMTKFKEWPDANIDVLVGGTPCQSFSVAGLRKGLDDPRGNLMLTYLAIAAKYRPKWVVWENVPGVLSSNGGLDFASFLQGLGECGYGFAYRVLDAQYFGVPQRRRRVFVVGHLGDWRRAAAVLFERHSLQRHPAPRREAGKGFTHPVAPSLTSSGRGVERGGDTRGQDPVIATRQWLAEVGLTLNAHYGDKWGLEDQHALGGAALFVPACGQGGKDIAGTITAGFGHNKMGAPEVDAGLYIPVTHSLRGEGFDGSEDGTGRGTPLVPVAIPMHDMVTRHAGTDGSGHQVGKGHGMGIGDNGDPMFTLGSDRHAVAFVHQAGGTQTTLGYDQERGTAPTLSKCQTVAVALNIYGGNKRADRPEGGFYVKEEETSKTLDSATGLNPTCSQGGTAVMSAMQVRRLTPQECERLQGFPDEYTQVPYRNKPAADGPRYKALGNSMAVPVMAWIGKRIQQVEEISCTTKQKYHSQSCRQPDTSGSDSAGRIA